MITSIKVNNIHFYSGIHSGLSTKTAVVKITYTGKMDPSETMQANFGKKFEMLSPADDFYIAMSREWQKSFLLQTDQVTEFSHWVVGLTTAMQLWARDPVWKGKVLKSSKDSMVLALPWEHKDVFKSALLFALKHLFQWSAAQQVPSVVEKLTKEYTIWLSKAQARGLAPNTLRFALSAMQRNIPVTQQLQYIKLGFGKNAIRMNSSFTDHTSVIGSSVARSKLQTNTLLRTVLIPVPVAGSAASYESALNIIKKIPFPVVVKPSNQDQGIGITTNIQNNKDLHAAFNRAKKHSPHSVIVEKHVQGDDHRMLVVKGKLLMSTKRIPGGITGDGKSTVEQLVDTLNKDPRRGHSKRSLMMHMELDKEANTLLEEQKLTVVDIPKKDQFVKLRHTANLSSGGTAIDVTDIVHPDNRAVAERAAEVIGLDIAGIDFLCPDISQSWKKVGGAVIEVNAQPGFRPHWVSVPDRDINGEVIDQLFQNKKARIPTAAISGTNGKTTTAKMLHAIWMSAGKNTGVCTTNGLWIGKDMISDENLSGNPGGRILLNDLSVEAAVIEMPRKGLIIFGHPTDYYDVSALLNIQNDHIGLGGINSLEEMATLKSEVIFRAKDAVIINAEDDLCMKTAQNINDQKLILVSSDKKLPLFDTHIQKGGAGVSVKMIRDLQWIILIDDHKETPLMPVNEIPATENGLVLFNISNAMFAAGLAWAQGVSLEYIRKGLSVFVSSMEQNPGRMNFVEGFPFKLLLDFSHNQDGIHNLMDFIEQIAVKGKKRVLIQTIGNRRRESIKESAADLAKTFDEFTVSCDPKYVKQNPEWEGDDPIGTMLRESVESLMDHGVSQNKIKVEPNKVMAINQVLQKAQSEDLLVILAEPHDAIPIIENRIDINV